MHANATNNTNSYYLYHSYSFVDWHHIMLAIKLKRIGKKHQPSYRIIVAEKKSKVSGRYVDDLGWMNPKSKEVKVDQERVTHWISVGAKPTETVHNLLVKSGVIQGAKISKHRKAKASKS